MRRRVSFRRSFERAASCALTIRSTILLPPKWRTEKGRKMSLKGFCKSLRLLWFTSAAPATVATRWRLNAYESDGTTTSFRHDVSRAGESRFEFRRNFFRRRAHDRDLLPAHLLGEKACADERRFLRDSE